MATACTCACLIECDVPLPREGRRIVPSVLVIDDDPSTTAFPEAALEGVGYHVQTAVHGDALQLPHHQPPAAILLDPVMPPMDGIEVRWRLRADPVTADIPIIVMSAQQRLDRTADRMPVNDRLPKPFTLAELYATVARWMEAA